MQCYARAFFMCTILQHYLSHLKYFLLKISKKLAKLHMSQQSSVFHQKWGMQGSSRTIYSSAILSKWRVCAYNLQCCIHQIIIAVNFLLPNTPIIELYLANKKTKGSIKSKEMNVASKLDQVPKKEMGNKQQKQKIKKIFCANEPPSASSTLGSY